MSLFRRKSLAQVIAEAGDPNLAEGNDDSGGLERHLGAKHLVALGVGAIIGAETPPETSHGTPDD